MMNAAQFIPAAGHRQKNVYRDKMAYIFPATREKQRQRQTSGNRQIPGRFLGGNNGVFSDFILMNILDNLIIIK
ncbi:hypothetical protein [Sodalis sp. RH19]|uniref:hypothetical protein n=1 Tax=Sodalis sp. RH19 TaxID=3394334 RepID=UPI0039B4C722